MEKSERFNKGKPQWDLIDYKSLEPMIRVLEMGAKKYSKDNWKKGLPLNEIQASMQRHLADIMDGETHDKESNELHMGHVMCNAMFWIYHYNKEQTDKEFVNRFK